MVTFLGKNHIFTNHGFTTKNIHKILSSPITNSPSHNLYKVLRGTNNRLLTTKSFLHCYLAKYFEPNIALDILIRISYQETLRN